MAESAFQNALISWRDIDLGTVQQKLHTQCADVQKYQEGSLVERKALSQRAKDFKKLPDEDKATESRPLIKEFQKGIDNLTERAKKAENYFLSLYNVLGKAPDPYPLLEATIDQLYSSEEAIRLERENKELRQKLSEAEDVPALKERLKNAEARAAHADEENVRAKESELNAAFAERERNWNEREADLQRQVNESRETIKELRANQLMAQAQRNKEDGQADTASAGLRAELDLLQQDVERARSQSAKTESRNLELRKEVEALKSEHGNAADLKAMDLEQKLSNLETDYHALGRKLAQSKEYSQKEADNLGRRIRELEMQLSRRVEEVQRLQARLSKFDDYDELKRELNMLKQIEFSIPDDEDGSQEASIEGLMRAQNRKLNDDLTTMRVKLLETEKQLEELAVTNKDTRGQLDELRERNERLEDDLTKMHDHSDAVSVAPSRFTKAPSTAWGRISPTSSIIGLREQPSAEVNAGILPIVTQQRDRFRAKNVELESEIRALHMDLSKLRSEIQTLQKDNLAMYERNRYLSNFRSDSKDTVLNMGGASKQGGALDRYASKYEDSVSPFEAFRNRETRRALQTLGPIERGIYHAARLVLSTKLSRMIFSAYMVLLHLFCLHCVW